MVQIAVFCRERGNDESDAESEHRHVNDQQRKKKYPRTHGETGSDVGEEFIVPIGAAKKEKLNHEADEVGNRDGDRRHEAWKIHLAENARVARERIAGGAEDVRK